MIDIHCHILPGIDDGAKNLDDSLAMCRMAVADGITHMTVTPHVHPGRFDNNLKTIQPVFDQLQQLLLAENIPLSISMAGEVRLSAEVLMLHGQKQLPFLGRWQGRQLMLLELPHDGIPPGSDKLAKWLLDRDILPMIAHPERNRAIAENINRLEPFLQLGCLLQLTAMSVTGRFGDSAFKAAHKILDQDWAAVVASDAHNVKSRPPILSEAFERVGAEYGAERAERLFVTNPGLIVGVGAIDA